MLCLSGFELYSSWVPLNNTGIFVVESLDLISAKGDRSGHDLSFISALKREGVNGVNRQPSKGLKFNRQPSKLEKISRQPSKPPPPLRPSWKESLLVEARRH